MARKGRHWIGQILVLYCITLTSYRHIDFIIITGDDGRRRRRRCRRFFCCVGRFITANSVLFQCGRCCASLLFLFILTVHYSVPTFPACCRTGCPSRCLPVGGVRCANFAASASSSPPPSVLPLLLLLLCLSVCLSAWPTACLPACLALLCHIKRLVNCGAHSSVSFIFVRSLAQTENILCDVRRTAREKHRRPDWRRSRLAQSARADTTNMATTFVATCTNLRPPTDEIRRLAACFQLFCARNNSRKL